MTYDPHPREAPRPRGADRIATPEETQEAIRVVAATPVELKPIQVALHAQEIGALWAQHASPTAFQQHLLEQFKAAGAPVEGILKLRLIDGKIFKLQNCPLGKEWIAYIWMPQPLYARLVEWRRMNGIDKALEPYAVGVE